MSNPSLSVYDGTVEFIIGGEKDMGTLLVSISEAEASLPTTVSIRGGDDTVLFETIVAAPLATQLECSRLLSDRRITLYDEPNEKNVELIFSSRADGNNFLMCLTAAVFRSSGKIEPVAIALNETEVRKNKAVEKPAELNYDVTLTISHVYVLSAAALAPVRADELPAGTKAVASVGGTPNVVTQQLTASLYGLLLLAKEGTVIVGSVDEAKLEADAPWLAAIVHPEGSTGEPQTAASGHIVSVAFVVTSIEQSDESKKDVLRKRLQKMGAHAAMPSVLSNNSFGNNSFAKNAPQAAPAVLREESGAPAAALTPEPSHVVVADESVVQATSAAEGDAPIIEKKKKKKKPAQTLQDELDAAEAAAAAMGPTAAESEVTHPSLDDQQQELEAPSFQDLVEFQLKLERKKQRVLKFESDVVHRHEELQHHSQMQSLKEAELAAQRATLEAEIAQFNQQKDAFNRQQKDAFNRQQLTFYQQKDNEDLTKFHSVKGKGSINRASSPSGAGGRETQPLLATTSEATFSFRVEQNFYDNTQLPPSFSRQYPITTAMLNVIVMSPIGLGVVLILIVAGAALLSTGLNQNQVLWPFLALDGMAFISLVNLFRHRQKLSDDLHRIDQSCSQFDPVVFILQRSLLFMILPTAILVAAVSPALLILATGMADTIGRVGVMVGLAGSALGLGTVYLYIVLASCVSWDRVASTVPPEPGVLCTRISLRRALAQYQYLKALVTSCNQEFSTDVLLFGTWLVTILVYCICAAVKYRSYDQLIAYNAIFAGCSILMWGLLRCVSSWQGATHLVIGTVAVHADRWARGDHNSETDVRLDDFVTLQTALQMSVLGSTYAKWTIGLGNNVLLFTVSRVWLYVFAALAVAAAVMIPVVIEYRLESFTA